MKKSILALLLAVLMVASLLPATALAEGEAVAKIGEQEYTTLTKAVEEVEDGQTITLLKNVEVTTPITLKGTNVTLDLNKFTISSSVGTVLVIGDGNVSSSISIKNGKVISEKTGSNTAVAVSKNTKLTVEYNAEIVGPYGLGTSDTNSADAGSGVVIDVYGIVRGINNTDGENYPGEGGSVGIGINGNIKSTIEYAKINIHPGAVVRGTNGTSSNANTADGPAIYAAGYAEWNISGGTITGDEALSIKSGKFNITGGEFIATGVYQDPATSWGNGTEATGAAISITNNNSYAKNVTLNIEGGTFFSKNGYAVYESDTNSQSGSALSTEGISISGGSFKGAQDDDLFSKNDTNFVTNGEFSKEVTTSYLDTDLKYQVKNGNTYTYYDTFENALKAAENGAEIKGVADALGTQYYTITIDPANGGAVTSYTVPSGSEIPLYTPSKSGYAFLGWSGSDGKTYAGTDTVTVTSDIKLTASWVRHPDTPYVPEPEEPEEPEVPEFPFYDVPTSAWYYTAVKYVYDNKLMDGVDTYVFAPNDTLTRAMVWTIIARMSGVDTTGGNTWYAKAQEWVITNGISDGENPTAAITREEFVTMLWRLAGEPIYTGDLSRVPDAGSISTWAQNAMLWSYVTSLTEGDENGALTPLATATRAQAAAMIMRFCESVK